MFKLATHTHTHTPVLCLHKSLENSDLQNHLEPRAEFAASNSVRGFLCLLMSIFGLFAVPNPSTSFLPSRAKARFLAPRRISTLAALCVLPLASMDLYIGAGLFICAVLDGFVARWDSFPVSDGAFSLRPRPGGFLACILPPMAEGAFLRSMCSCSNINQTKENKWHGTESRNGTSPGMGWT